MLSSKTRWIQKKTNEELAKQLSTQLSISNMVANLLVSRGITTAEEANSFLNIEKTEFHDPFLLTGMDQTVKRIHQAIDQHEKILVFGDYDADGVSSTTVMLRALRAKGAHADFYIPNRFREGYGPNRNAFQWAKEQGYRLIITVDTGISALSEAQFAKELEMDLIITDHHEPGPELPDAFSIIHPKLPGGAYPCKELAGVGVALKVAHALLGECPTEYVGMAAIGTIADLVPLHDENRLIAVKGIKALKTTNNPGIRALLSVCNVDQRDVTEETIGFSIGPRINAAGRLGDADPAVELFLTEDAEEAEFIANEINELNKERQKIVNEITLEAIELVEKEYPLENNSVLVIGKKGWNAGVIGIVASRLVEKYYRPTIVLSIDEEGLVAKGSARSIEGFDLFENLSTCRDILPHFGGHTMAAGMTVDVSNVGELRERLILLANDKLTEEDFIPVTHVDVVCKLEEITIDSIEELSKLAPYGMGNPKPKVTIPYASLSQMKKIGQDQSHLKLLLEQSGTSLDAIAFGFGEAFDQISNLAKVSILGELSINEWNNFRKPQVMVNDILIEEWQLFDWRGHKTVNKQIESISPNKRKIIVFNEETIERLNLHNFHDHILRVQDQDQQEISGHQDYLVLADLPPSLSLLEQIITTTKPARIYTIFHQSETHFFNTIPTREHFKWFYGFLGQNKQFNYKTQGDQLAKHRGWSKETIQFMLKVFFELEFVTIDSGMVTLSNSPQKRDLTDSKTYMLKQNQIEIENMIMYSSYSQLKDWFDHVYRGLVTV
ncbi:single-stranded-DNA-specific exonuclease [Bacillus mesophilus]|uniref:Single-stranded-DNA-specific exonuclease RecJ n=1 Tax=Bacillus mesophilus TaxID=1808955 RepID=A0A6M0Q5X3_9BACI|nr:single-stranded-DNA-specific exonuclease RecJ [Bacillus mesophilus]MBM7660697.1 single-stranded-DNA-specific exonuclease [Bacillus mesophilus]NEY71756.1 single-stranded-DNA-specific exonuclease RecJ [Bacillus mesophilus]